MVLWKKQQQYLLKTRWREVGSAVGVFWCNTGPSFSSILINRGHFIKQIDESANILQGEISTHLHISAYISFKCAAVK